jgi:hypothetical protein
VSCPHSDLMDPSWCSMCLHPAKGELPVFEKNTALAKYKGTCFACEGTIIIGDLLRSVGGYWYHDECVACD